MSYNVSLYIDGASSLKEFADEISSLLDIGLWRVERFGEVRYERSNQDFTVQLYSDHGMENDRDMRFEDYPYELSLWRHNSPDPEETQARTLRFARLAFERLRATRRYSMMLVENSQRKLDSFELAQQP